MIAIHLKETLAVTANHPGTFKEVPFGTGCVDFPRAFSKLKDLGYAGPFLVEMWTERAEDPITEISEAKQWIFRCMREGGLIDE